MSESSNSAWPFGEISAEEGLDIEAIFKDSTGADQSNPFASPVEDAAPAPAPEAQEPQKIPSLRPLSRKQPRTPRKGFWKSRRYSITRASKRRLRTPL